MNPIIKRIVSVLVSVVFAVGIIFSGAGIMKSEAAVYSSDIVSYARQFIGYPYVWGTHGPNSFDCSGFVHYVFSHFGISLPTSSSSYWNSPTAYGTLVSQADMKPGDVLAWSGHVGIYSGNDKCINAANSNDGVCEKPWIYYGSNPKIIRINGVDYGTPTLTPQTAPTNAWVTASATTVKVGEPVTFTYGAQGAYSQAFNYYINGSLTTIFIGFGTQQYTYTFNSPGTYITHITNYNDYGLTDSQDIVIYVYNSTPTNAWAEASATTVQVGEPVTFTYGAQGAISYAFNYFINGNLTVIDVGYATQYTYTFNSPGTYITHITNYNNYGLTDSQDIVVYVYDKPINAWAEASATTVQVGEPVTFTYGAQGAYSQAFNYYINGSLTTIFIGFGTQQYTYTFNSPGTYITHITNYNDYGLTDSQDIVVYVYDKPINAWAEASATTVQVGEPITFTYGAQGAYSQAFNYYINGNLTTIFIGFGTQQYTYTFDNPGTYITHITNYNDYGLTDSQDIVINVYDPNTIYTVTFDPNGGSNAPASQTKTYGQTMTLSAGIPTRMGYTFAGWNTKADGSGTNYTPGASYTAEADVTLYAQWVANPPVVNPAVGSGAVVNESKHFIYGLSAGVTQSCVAVTDGTATYEYPTAKSVMGTGTKVKVYDIEQELVDTYTIVIFGDVNGDSWYDGTDAYLVNLVANGMVSADNLTEAQRAAADCNHDGNIDNADVALLEQAGLLLANVDQTMPQEELQTDSVYLEYCSLIDQSITITEPEQPAADQPAQTAAQPAASSVWGWIKALFTIVLNWLLRVF